jgi:hypothetical protein
MIRLMARMARASLRLYPHAWRARYGDELAALVEESQPRGRDLVDLALVGIGLRVSSLRTGHGGVSMIIGPAQRHPTAFAAGAMALMLPTTAFVVLSILGHELGLTGIAERIDPVITAVTASRFVDLALVAAPAVSLLLAVAPVVELGLGGTPGRRVVTLGLRLRTGNLVVAAIALTIGALLLSHVLVETVLHAAR